MTPNRWTGRIVTTIPNDSKKQTKNCNFQVSLVIISRLEFLKECRQSQKIGEHIRKKKEEEKKIQKTLVFEVKKSGFARARAKA